LANSNVIDANASFIDAQQQNWINLAQQGDQAAFHQLYLHHHKRVYALCWRMLADKDSAEDVCQEVFVQLWQKIANFHGNSKFSTWLHSVTTNIVLNHLRKNKNWLQRVFSIEDQLVSEKSDNSMQGTIENSEMAMLDQHIKQLPERARIVFVLFAVEGYRHEEIAQMMKMAVGSSKAQYHRARNLLKASLRNKLTEG
jgi:RNA polymerase sigma-70 factor, ECF subfamily